MKNKTLSFNGFTKLHLKLTKTASFRLSLQILEAHQQITRNTLMSRGRFVGNHSAAQPGLGSTYLPGLIELVDKIGIQIWSTK